MICGNGRRDQWGKEAPFSKLDYFGIQGELSFKSWESLSQAHVIVKRSDWSSQSCDYHIDLLPVYLPTEVWLIEGDHQVYYSLQAATRATNIRGDVLIISMWLCAQII